MRKAGTADAGMLSLTTDADTTTGRDGTWGHEFIE
jgi:hypothetical protein